MEYSYFRCVDIDGHRSHVWESAKKYNDSAEMLQKKTLHIESPAKITLISAKMNLAPLRH
jgi:hypothetical protein